VFPTRGEADAYHGKERSAGSADQDDGGASQSAPLDADRVLRDLVADLQRRGRIAADRAWNTIPLTELAPVDI